MKSLIVLWCELAREIGELCCTSTIRDVKTVTERFESEGDRFFTITLPEFGKRFERALELGSAASTEFPSFRVRGCLPEFLGGLTERVFDEQTGALLDDPSRDCIWAVRQLTLAPAKILVDKVDETRSRDALEQYIQTESEVQAWNSSASEGLLMELEEMSTLLYDRICEYLDDQVLVGNILCGHGSGATADGLMGNRKFDQTEWPVRLDQWFPWGDHGQPNLRFDYLRERVNFLDPGTERPVKVITVPKTQKTDRVIAEEPTCMMYVQQGISKELTQELERDRILSPMIGFTDQRPNQALARKGSLYGNLATLDLSEASDRVSYEHVRVMLHRYPFLWGGVDAARSRKAHVLDQDIVLAKFASMGSALTFPLEAMVFLAVVFLGIQDGLGHHLSRKDLRRFHGKVRVYGDDIIVPTEFVQHVIARLEAFGFKVNSDKSFWNGKFRESCGKEYYNGHDVSISRFRRVLPTSRADVREIISTVALRNQLYYAGCFETARYLDSVLLPILDGYFPAVEVNLSSISYMGWVDESNPRFRSGQGYSGSPLLGRFDFSGFTPEGNHADRHGPVVRGWVVRTRLPRNKATGEGALLKYFLKRGDQPFADRKHLERSGRSEPVSIRLRWASPY